MCEECTLPKSVQLLFICACVQMYMHRALSALLETQFLKFLITRIKLYAQSVKIISECVNTNGVKSTSLVPLRESSEEVMNVKIDLMLMCVTVQIG